MNSSDMSDEYFSPHVTLFFYLHHTFILQGIASNYRHSGNIQAIFRQHSGNIPATFRQE